MPLDLIAKCTGFGAGLDTLCGSAGLGLTFMEQSLCARLYVPPTGKFCNPLAPGRAAPGILAEYSRHCFLSSLPLPTSCPKHPPPPFPQHPAACRGPTLTGRSKGLEAGGLQQRKWASGRLITGS